MAEIPTSIAISPSGTTLLNAMQVTTTAGVVLNEVVTLGDNASGQVATVLASGALLVESGGVNVQPVSGTLTVVQPTATALNVTVGNFPAAQTVTGTVAIGGPLGQTTMAASIPVVIASNQATFPVTVTFPATQTVTGTVIVTPPATQTVAGTVAITSTSAQSITAVGTMTVVQPTATALNVAAVQVTTPWTIIGSVTANAGTNLNTSLLALESGGNLAKIASVTGAPGATFPGTSAAIGLRGATTFPTAVTDGQLASAMGDKAGRQVAVLNAPRDLISPLVISPFTATGTAFGILTAAASSFYDFSSLIITNPQTVATTFTLADGVNSYPFNLAPNGGIAHGFPSPLPMGAAAATWTGQLSAVGTVSFIAIYVKNK
jgi:hypothetical protein